MGLLADSHSIKPSDKYVTWESNKLINGHMLLLGKSGAGKSFTLRDWVTQMSNKDSGLVRIHVIDVHGDMSMPNESVIKFSESTFCGFNPLVINPDPDFGGVRKRIQSFTGHLMRTGFRLGPKQEATLKALLGDLYASFGFKEDDASTWKGGSFRKQPTLEDAVKFAEEKLKALYLGTDAKTVTKLESVYKLKGKLNRKLKDLTKLGSSVGTKDEKKMGVLNEEIAKLQEECDKIIDETKISFGEHLESVKTGLEFDELIKYDSKDVMKSVADRLNNLKSTGVYRSIPPRFNDKSLVWRYDIRAFSEPEQKLFVGTLLEEIFNRRLQEGLKDDVVECIILDEAHKFFTDDDENPLNTIAKEARKFGLSLIAASQSPKHFSDDFLSNVGTKVILSIDQMFWGDAVRKLKVSEKALAWITPHQTFLATMSEKGVGSQRFIPVQVIK